MPAPTRTARPSAGPSLAWDDVLLAPVVLVQGPESLLAERAVDAIVGLRARAGP